MTEKDLTKVVSDFVTPVDVVLYPEQTLQEALDHIRKRDIGEKIIYFYVVDHENHLIGVVPTRKLLLKDPSLKIDEIMVKTVISLDGSSTLQQAMEFLESHRLLALPVVDDEKRLLGLVDVDLYLEESVDVAHARRRSDIFQLIGIYLEEGKRATAFHAYKGRMPWIFSNILGGFACAAIANFYEAVLAKILVLAMFIPLLLSLSESISMQSLTQSMQTMMRQSKRRRYFLLSLYREWKVLALLAVSCGLIVGSASILWGDGIGPAIIIGISSMITIVLSATIGASLPILLRARSWDPKVASGPIVLMSADVLTTFIYLSLATLFLLKL